MVKLLTYNPKPSFVDTLTPKEREEIEQTEMTHFGDPDKETGIYAPGPRFIIDSTHPRYTRGIK